MVKTAGFGRTGNTNFHIKWMPCLGGGGRFHLAVGQQMSLEVGADVLAMVMVQEQESCAHWLAEHQKVSGDRGVMMESVFLIDWMT